MGSSGQKTKGPFANICQAYKNQLCAGGKNPTATTDTTEPRTSSRSEPDVATTPQSWLA